MPLRDHFRSPVNDRHRWDGLHAMWPATIVRQLFDILPEGYEAEPGVHFGNSAEIDIAAFEVSQSRPKHPGQNHANGVIPFAEPVPTLTLETEIAEQDEFEVRVYDRGRELVAAIELVSPANKDRPESRRAFVAKAAALLQKGVCVSIVDLVTIRQFSLYADLLELLGHADRVLGDAPPHLYAVSLRARKQSRGRSYLDTWHYPMATGQALPILPIWLGQDLRVLLPLEDGYQETCRLLHIP
jgi:hypothetical protein